MESKLNPIVLKSLDLRVSLVRLSHGVAFKGLRDEKTGTDFFSGEYPLFTLTLKSLADGQVKTLDSLDGWEVSVKEGGSQITLCRPELHVFLSAVCGERRSVVESHAPSSRTVFRCKPSPIRTFTPTSPMIFASFCRTTAESFIPTCRDKRA